MDDILTKEQIESIIKYLTGPPVSLREGLSKEDYPRQIDVYINETEKCRNTVYDWDNNYIRKGRFFDLVSFSNLILFALHLGHDRYGILGEIKILESVNPNDVKIKRDYYDKLLEEIRGIVNQIELEILFSCNKFALMNNGPVIT